MGAEGTPPNPQIIFSAKKFRRGGGGPPLQKKSAKYLKFKLRSNLSSFFLSVLRYKYNQHNSYHDHYCHYFHQHHHHYLPDCALGTFNGQDLRYNRISPPHPTCYQMQRLHTMMHLWFALPSSSPPSPPPHHQHHHYHDYHH